MFETSSNTRMKFLIPIALAAFLCGCGTTGPSPLLTPAALTVEVSAAVSIGLEAYPQAQPEVALARDVICSEVAKTNVNPQAIVADLSKLGITNSTSRIIIDSGVIVYNTVWTLLTTNQTAAAEPYLSALCTGFSQALPANGPGARRVARRSLPPHI